MMLNFIIKITSLDLENPLGCNADGTISIPKEVILLALYLLALSQRITAGSTRHTPFFPQRKVFSKLFVGDSHSNASALL
ncbi:MAG: hypothetical protein Q4B06_03435 [Candidatus Saccharibacteria bacterium]|nr:hypothetical protein [Candidatus Saccharibacteria bacterium]